MTSARISNLNHPSTVIRRLTSDRLAIATHNPGKLAEMRELLAPYDIAAISAGELGLAEPDENGMTFRDNTCIKAAAAAQATKLPALADDSGLAVEALDGAPGIHSARWAGSDRNFDRAMAAIETQLRARGATAPEHRRAQGTRRFRLRSRGERLGRSAAAGPQGILQVSQLVL